MGTPGSTGEAIGFDAFGVGVTVVTSGPVRLADVRRCLPAGAGERAPAAGDDRFAFSLEPDGRTTITINGAVRAERESLVGGLMALDAHLYFHVLGEADDRLFIHAGAVGIGGCGVILTGGIGIGKSTLVAALVRAGARFYADDYAPIDAEGRVHPYTAVPVTTRDPATGERHEHSARELGGEIGDEPVQVGVIARIEYGKRADLQLSRGTAGDGSLMLLENSFGADRRPALALRATASAAGAAVVLRGTRAEADAAAAALIELVARGDRPQ